MGASWLGRNADIVWHCEGACCAASLVKKRNGSGGGNSHRENNFLFNCFARRVARSEKSKVSEKQM